MENYSRFSYFYKGIVDFAKKYQWSVVYVDRKKPEKSQVLLGPFEFLIRDPSGSGEKKYLILSDTDDSYNSNETWNMLQNI